MEKIVDEETIDGEILVFRGSLWMRLDENNSQ